MKHKRKLLVLFGILGGAGLLGLALHADLSREKKPPTAEGKVEPLPASVKVSQEQASLSGTSVPVLVVRHFGDVLECQKNTYALATEALFVRKNGRLSATVWTRRGEKALKIDGFDRVTRGPRPSLVQQGLKPGYATDKDYADAGVEVLEVPKFKTDNSGVMVIDEKELLIKSNAGSKKVPWGNFSTGSNILSPNYRFCGVLKEGRSFTPVSIVIVDLEKLEICGEVPIPSDLPAHHPLLILDPDAHALLVMAGRLDWLIIVDLAPLFAVSASKNRASPGPGGSAKALPDSVKVLHQKVNMAGQEVPYVLIKQLREALEPEPGAGAGVFRVKTSRVHGKLEMLAFSHLAQWGLGLDGNAKPSLMPSPGIEGIHQGLLAGRSNTQVRRAEVVMPSSDRRLIIRSKAGNNTVPFGPFSTGAVIFAENYRYCGVLKTEVLKPGSDPSMKPVSVLIIDLENLAIAVDIPLPPDLPVINPEFTLDPEAHALACIDGELNWMILVDLKLLEPEPKIETPAEKEQQELVLAELKVFVLDYLPVYSRGNRDELLKILPADFEEGRVQYLSGADQFGREHRILAADDKTKYELAELEEDKAVLICRPLIIQAIKGFENAKGSLGNGGRFPRKYVFKKIEGKWVLYGDEFLQP